MLMYTTGVVDVELRWFFIQKGYSGTRYSTRTRYWVQYSTGSIYLRFFLKWFVLHINTLKIY